MALGFHLLELILGLTMVNKECFCCILRYYGKHMNALLFIGNPIHDEI